MTRKDYPAIATALYRARRCSDYHDSQEAMLTMHAACANELATMFASENPAFDTERFLRDAGATP